jgi:hypothetical protein
MKAGGTAMATEGRSERKETSTDAKARTPMSAQEVRKAILDLVNVSAVDIVSSLVDAAKEGQVASAKYLFEFCGLFPVHEEMVEKKEDSLAYTLLKRMGLPTEPITEDQRI